ncbi:MAG: nucleoside transporter C-terminal domain-containing protein [Myxococcota bacterium]|nr:nucleoside transporter C-terminal domain-containing protein [Myxococcota bacterium]
MPAVQAGLGLLVFPLLAWLIGQDRRRVRPQRLLLGICVQLLMGMVLLRTPGVAEMLLWLNDGVLLLESATAEGSRFMFGYLAGGELPFEERSPGGAFIVAFRVLPLVLVVSAVSAVLHHVGVIPLVVRMLAAAVQTVFRTGGPLAFGAASSVFFGIIEGPVLIRPWLSRMAPAELFALMVCGMSTVAGTVMVLYASIIEPVLPGALGQILVASLLSVPAALTISHAMLPAGDGPDTIPVPERPDPGVVDALMRGTAEGTKMVLDIAATIIVLFALVHLVNRGLSMLPGDGTWTLQDLVGGVFRPLLWLTGLSWAETLPAGELMGTKTVLNEFVAYMDLADGAAMDLSPRSRRVVVTTLCGFANLGSLGILVGGLGSVIPDRKTELAGLAGRAVVAGTLATLLTGSVVSLVAPSS